MYTSDLPPLSAPVQVMAYADDITITSTHTSTSAAKKYIQPYLHKVFVWTKQNNLIQNADKTTCTLFTPDPTEYTSNLHLTINNKALPMAMDPKVLGLTLDPKLTYSTRIRNISVHTHKPLQIIKTLTATGWCKQKEEEEEVATAIKGLKIRKSAGLTGVVNEMMKAAGGFGSGWMTDLINNIVKEGCIPDDWRKSILVHVYKGKGDPLVCESYRAIRLLEQLMKVLERVLEKRIRCQVSIDNMQFGFMPGKGTTDAIFIMRQVQDKHQAKKKKLYYAFVDLEKAFDRVPREVVRWALRKLGVDEWLISTVMALYTEACTIVRTDAGLSESFEVKVGLHQGSVLSPLLFAAVMDVVSSEARNGLPSELLYADDLVIMAPTMEQLGRRVADWRASLLGKD